MMPLLIDVLLLRPSAEVIAIAERLVSLALFMPDMVALVGHVILLRLDMRVRRGLIVTSALVGRLIMRRRGRCKSRHRNFAKRKALLRKVAERSIEAMWDRIDQFLDAFSPEECAPYLRHAGYAPT